MEFEVAVARLRVGLRVNGAKHTNDGRDRHEDRTYLIVRLADTTDAVVLADLAEEIMAMAHGQALCSGRAGHCRRRHQQAGRAVGWRHGEQDCGTRLAGRPGPPVACASTTDRWSCSTAPRPSQRRRVWCSAPWRSSSAALCIMESAGLCGDHVELQTEAPARRRPRPRRQPRHRNCPWAQGVIATLRS